MLRIRPDEPGRKLWRRALAGGASTSSRRCEAGKRDIEIAGARTNVTLGLFPLPFSSRGHNGSRTTLNQGPTRRRGVQARTTSPRSLKRRKKVPPSFELGVHVTHQRSRRYGTFSGPQRKLGAASFCAVSPASHTPCVQTCHVPRPREPVSSARSRFLSRRWSRKASPVGSFPSAFTEPAASGSVPLKWP